MKSTVILNIAREEAEKTKERSSVNLEAGEFLMAAYWRGYVAAMEYIFNFINSCEEE